MRVSDLLQSVEPPGCILQRAYLNTYVVCKILTNIYSRNIS